MTEKKRKLFDPKYALPCDEVGPFEDVVGIVTYVDDERLTHGEVQVKVMTEFGEFTGYTGGSTHVPKVGYAARMHIYQIGGGWYPDDRVVGWSSSGRTEDV